ncbi:MAG: hypothetical protein E7262_01105 [Lachnospiraceae bacterium]|nr:hypothetical protein [Lachnospiraceae bacterium]
MQYIPLTMVLIAALITIVIGLVKKFEIIFCLKILSIVIILFYIIGNIVKNILIAIMKMNDEQDEENKEDEQAEDGRADEPNDTSEKSGDDFEE